MKRGLAELGSNLRKLAILMIDGSAVWQVVMSLSVGLLAALSITLVSVLLGHIGPVLPHRLGSVLFGGVLVLPPFLVLVACLLLVYDVVWTALGFYRFMGWEERAIARKLLRRLGGWSGQFREQR